MAEEEKDCRGLLKRRDIKKKWKARRFLERDSESSGDNGKDTSELTFNPETGLYSRKAWNKEKERREEEKEAEKYVS